MLLLEHPLFLAIMAIRRLHSYGHVVTYIQMGPCPMQLVVPIAVRNAVSAATITFTASSMILCFFILGFLLPRKNTDEHGVYC